MGYIIPNFLVLHFGESFMKIRTKYQSYRCMKICIRMWMKTCFHSHFYTNFQSFYDGQLKQQTCYSLIWCFIHLKWQASSFRLHQNFPILMVQILFSPNSTGPWPRPQKGREITIYIWSLSSHAPTRFLSPIALQETATFHTTWRYSDLIVE